MTAMTTSLTFRAAAAALLIAASGVATADPGDTTVDFSNGEAGWTNLPQVGDQGSWIEPGGGAGGSDGWRTRNVETWGLTWSNNSNASFIGDYTKAPAIQFGIDIKADSIVFRGEEVSRDVIVELRDYDHPTGPLGYTSLWFNLGSIDATKGWQHLGVTISDTSSTALPGGWSIHNGTDTTGLPAGRSFASFLQGVDEIAFSTMVPGWFYGYTSFDVTVDNIRVAAVPEPSTYAMLAAGLALLGVVGRRRRGADRP